MSKDRWNNIGFSLGAELAHRREDYGDNPHDDIAFQKIVQISEIYKNFSNGNLPGFVDDFAAGYENAMEEILAPKYQPDETEPSASFSTAGALTRG